MVLMICHHWTHMTHPEMWLCTTPVDLKAMCVNSSISQMLRVSTFKLRSFVFVMIGWEWRLSVFFYWSKGNDLREFVLFISSFSRTFFILSCTLSSYIHFSLFHLIFLTHSCGRQRVFSLFLSLHSHALKV